MGESEKVLEELKSSVIVSYRHLPNSSRFKMISAIGVDWSERSTKLGNVHYYDDHLYLVFDFPNGEITESYVPRIHDSERGTQYELEKFLSTRPRNSAG